MTGIIERQCAMNGCKFLVEANDPTICKCAAEVHGKRPQASEQERRLDAMLCAPELERGIMRLAIERLNERAST